MINFEEYNKIQEAHYKTYNELYEYCEIIVEKISQIDNKIGTELSLRCNKFDFDEEFEYTDNSLIIHTEETFRGESSYMRDIIIPSEFIGYDKINDFLKYYKKKIEEKKKKPRKKKKLAEEIHNKRILELERAEYERLKKKFENNDNS